MAGKSLTFADFSNMFAEIDDEAIPQCLSLFLEAVPNGLISLNLSQNIVGSQGHDILR